MAIAYHTHIFSVPTASNAEAETGVIDNKALVPANLPPILATKQDVSDSLTSISGLTTSANQTIYTTAENAYATTSLTSIGRDIIGGANAAAIRALIDAQQQFDSLDAIGALSPLADRLPYFTDTDTAALTTFTSFARTLLDDADAATAQQTLELEPGVDVQGYEPILQEFADLTLGTEGQVLAVGAGSALEWTDAGAGDMLALTYDGDNVGLDVYGGRVQFADKTAAAAATIATAVKNVTLQAFSASANAYLGGARYRQAVDLTEYNSYPAQLRFESANGRYFVVNEPILNPYMAGAVGDGTTNDETACQACVTATPAGGTILIPEAIFAVGRLSINKSLTIVSERGTILRHPSTTQNSVLSVTGAKVTVRGLIVDGNRDNTTGGTAACRVSSGTTNFVAEKCEFRGGKESGGFGEGLAVFMTANDDESLTIRDCLFIDNDKDGCLVADATDYRIIDNTAKNNGGGGIICNNFDVTFAQKVNVGKIRGNTCTGNAGSGIGVGNLIQDNNLSASPRLYGYLNFEATNVLVSGNICTGNSGYGIAASGQYLSVCDNTLLSNGSNTGGSGGMLATVRYSRVTNNTVAASFYYGIDAGAAYDSVFQDNLFLFNGRDGIGNPLNIGGGRNVLAQGNKFRGNVGRCIYVQNYEGDGAGGTFPLTSLKTVIIGNTFEADTGTRVIWGNHGIVDTVIADNYFSPAATATDLAECVVVYGNRVTVSGNKIDPSISITVNPTGSTLVVPDVLDKINISAVSGTITQILTQSQFNVGMQAIGYCTVTAGGSGYTSAPTVSFTGGGGTGATATAFIENGRVLAIRVDNRGSGYTSAPTISFTGGGGTGAAATATVGVPLPINKELQIHCNVATTFAQGGNPAFDAPGSADVVVPASGSITLHTVFNQWRVKALVV